MLNLKKSLGKRKRELKLDIKNRKKDDKIGKQARIEKLQEEMSL